MPNIYEDALADVKKLKEVAEQNVTNALIESIAPNVRRMIEQKLDIVSADDVPPVDNPDDMLLDDVGATPGVEVQGVGATGKVVLDLGKLTGAQSVEPTLEEPAIPLNTAFDVDVDDDVDGDVENGAEDDVEDDTDEPVFEVTTESLEPLINMMLESDDFVKNIDAALSESLSSTDRLIAEVRYATTNVKTLIRIGKRLAQQNKLDYDVYDAHAATARNDLYEAYKRLCACDAIDGQLAETLQLELELANARLYESPNEKVETVRQQIISVGKRVKNAILEVKNGANANKYKEIEGAFSRFHQGSNQCEAIDGHRKLQFAC